MITDPHALTVPRSGWDFDPDGTTVDDVAGWAMDEYLAGENAAVELLPIDLTRASQPFIEGWTNLHIHSLTHNGPRTKAHRLAKEALMNINPNPLTITPTDADSAIAKQEEAFVLHAAAVTEATALVEDAAEASMAPQGISHYESAELAEAMAVWEKYGRWSTNDNDVAAWNPGYVRPLRIQHDKTGQPMPGPDVRSLMAMNPLLRFDTAYRQVKRALHAMTLHDSPNFLRKLAVDFTLRPFGEFAPAGTMQLVGVATNAGSVAEERGEGAWLVAVVHQTITTVNPVTGELRIIEKFREPGRLPADGAPEFGVLGIVATFPDLDALETAMDDLGRARTVIARARFEAENPLTEDEVELRATGVAPELATRQPMRRMF